MMTDPKYPDGAPEWYKPYMICEFSDYEDEWRIKGPAIYAPSKPGDSFPWLMAQGSVWFRSARPVQPWTPKVGEEVIAWDIIRDHKIIGRYGGDGRAHIVSGLVCDHVARLHNEDGSCIDVSGGIEAIKTRTPWV